MKNAKRGGGECWWGGLGCLWVCLTAVCAHHSSRNYTVPDPPGLFDGHVWPMYLKHKNIMEESDVDVGQLVLFLFQR